MPHFNSLAEAASALSLGGCVLTIGTFDGVHSGHQVVLRGVIADARRLHLPSVVIYFFPSPAEVLRGVEQRYYLTHPDQRSRYMSALGIDHTISINFSTGLAAQPAETFMQQVCQALHPAIIRVGYDFALGKGRNGDIPALQKLGNELGYELINVAPEKVGSEIASSSQIRILLKAGKVHSAARLLGRLYSLEGPVVRGDQIGASLGFPTANLRVWDRLLLPLNGVYATLAWLGETYYPSVTNIGIRPTITGSGEMRVETHILDFSQDIYDRILKIELVDFLRPEKSFASRSELVLQVQQDIAHAREVLAYAP